MTASKTKSSTRPASSTRTDERVTTPEPPAQPEVMHNRTRRHDRDALHGHTVEIVADVQHDVLGALKGKQGIFERTESYEKDGLPRQVIVSLPGVSGFLLSLPYKDIKHVPDAVKPARWTRSDA